MGGEEDGVDRARAGPDEDLRPLATGLEQRGEDGEHADLVGAASAAAGQHQADTRTGHGGDVLRHAPRFLHLSDAR